MTFFLHHLHAFCKVNGWVLSIISARFLDQVKTNNTVFISNCRWRISMLRAGESEIEYSRFLFQHNIYFSDKIYRRMYGK